MKRLFPLTVLCGLACLSISAGGEEQSSQKSTAELPVIASQADQAETAKVQVARRNESARSKRKSRRSDSTTAIAVGPKLEATANFGVEVASVSDGRFSVIRWNLKTGKSWISVEGVMTDITEIAGHEPVAGGLYQIKLTNTRPGRVGGVRMELGSGKTWHLNERQWIPMLDDTSGK